MLQVSGQHRGFGRSWYNHPALKVPAANLLSRRVRTSWSRGFLVCALAAVAAVLVACTTSEPEAYVERAVEELYNEAANLLATGNYLNAARAFDEVERQHPYSIWATRAQLMGAYSYYRGGRLDEAIIACERFLQLHPGSPDAPYAHYLAAVSFYDQIVDVGRDQAMTESALENLQQVVLRYPDTEYARDARLKINLANEHLAGKEMEIGRFYLNRRQFTSAINRFRTVIEVYETTSHTPEALHRLTESYLALGVASEAQAIAAVLGYNFPDSDWYQDSYRLLAESGIAAPDIEAEAAAGAAGGMSMWQRMIGLLGGG